MSTCAAFRCGREFEPRTFWQEYCSSACKQAEYASLKPELKSEWNRRAYEKRAPEQKRKRAQERSIRPSGLCQECGKELPLGSQRAKKFCDRKCINARSLRLRRERRLESAHRYRARRRGVTGLVVSERDWNRLVRRYNFRCAYCFALEPLTMDHVVPLSRGGRHCIGNIVPACLSCNCAKGARTVTEWLIARARQMRPYGRSSYIVS